MTIDVAALLAAEQRGVGGNRCLTCTWLEARPDAERKQWEEALEDTGSFAHAQIARVMNAAAEPGPGKVSISNHRNAHGKNR